MTPPLDRVSGHFQDPALETLFRAEYGGILVRRDRIVAVLIFILETILILVDQSRFQAVPDLSVMRSGIRAFYMLTLVIAASHYLARESYNRSTQRFIAFSMLAHNLVIATYHHPFLTTQMTPGFLLAVYIFTITAYYTFLSASLSGTMLVSVALGAQYLGLRWWFDAPDLDQIYAPFLLFGLIFFCHITALNQARHRRLIWLGSHLAVQRQKAAEEARFFSNRLLKLVGHDLNQPLGALRFLATSMSIGAQPDSPEHDRALLAAQHLGRALDQITDMLDKAIELAQLDASEGYAPCRAQSVEPLAGKLREQFAGFATLHGVEIRVYGERCVLAHDPPLMLPVLRNLLRNAIDHHSHLTRRPRVLLAFRGNANGSIDVIDNGGGLSEAALTNWHSDVTAGHRGTRGLGLVIARQLALRQGWQLTLHNQPGHGAHFRLHLCPDAAACA